jgi:hypothetical protein
MLSKVTNPAALLDVIAKAETGGTGPESYDTPSSHTKIDASSPLSGMTVAQVLEWQKMNRAAGARSTAAGRYQIINKTLLSLVAQLGVDPETKFDAATQDLLGSELLRQRGFDKWSAGEIDDARFATSLSKEWASFPNPVTGKSNYDGDGLNKHQISTDAVFGVLASVRGGAPVTAPFPVPKPTSDRAMARRSARLTQQAPGPRTR